MRNLNFSGCFQDAFLHLYFSCSSVICIVLGVLWFFLFVIQSISWMNIVFTLYTHDFNSFLWSLLKITKVWLLLCYLRVSWDCLCSSVPSSSCGSDGFPQLAVLTLSSPPQPSSLSRCLFPYFLLLSLLFLCWNFLYFCFFHDNSQLFIRLSSWWILKIL